MIRLHRWLKQTTLGVALSMLLSIPTAIPPAHLALATAGTIAVGSITVTTTACGPNTLEELNTTLNKIAHALEAAVDTNGRLYEAGAYGAKGSPEAIAMRQKVAHVIVGSNDYLIQALTIAKGLTKATFEGSKLLILEKLSLAATGLAVGQATVDLVLQSVATLINQAVAITQLFKASDVNYMNRIVPALNEHLKVLDRVRELNAGTEVFAE